MPAKGASAIEIEAPTEEPLLSPPARGTVPPAILLRGVTKAFSRPSGTVVALSELSLTVRRREVLGIVGPSGCGKSTLLELVAGLASPTAGELSVAGRAEPDGRLRACALMPQRDLLLPWRSALANAALPLEIGGASRSEARRSAEPLFERFGLAGFAKAPPSELSGGMRQRVAFIRTLLAGKPVLLLDEPFGALDSISRGDLQEWLAGTLLAEPRTVVLVSHDVEEALYLCDRVLVLSERPGRVKAEIEVSIHRPRPRRETVTSAAFTHLREQALEALA